MPKVKVEAVEARVPAAEFDIPEGMRDGELGIESSRTCNPWVIDRVLGFLGAYSVEIIDSIAVAGDGKYVELRRDGDKLQLFDKL
jgi:hypothetical protein